MVPPPPAAVLLFIIIGRRPTTSRLLLPVDFADSDAVDVDRNGDDVELTAN